MPRHTASTKINHAFQLLFANNPFPMWVYDLETLRFLEVNEAAVARYGYSREEFLKMRILDIRPHEEIPRVLQHVAANRPALQDSGEWRHRRKSGELIDVYVVSHTLDFAGRKAVLVVAQDITERKRSERLLRDSEERYRELFDNANDMIFTIDLTGRFTSMNARATLLTGYTLDEALAKDITHITAPEYHSVVRHMMRGKLSCGEATPCELEIIAKDGRRIPLEMSLRMIYRDGQPVGLQGIARDITERKQAEGIQHKLAAIVESSNDAIIGTTLDTMIQTWNSGAQRIYSYSAEEVIGRPISILAPPDRATEYREICERLIRGEHVNHFETIRVRKDGTHFHLSLTVSLVQDASGKIIGTAGIGRDITERKRAEEALGKAREAERANQAKSEFLSRMSHELRTPLNAILGFAQLLDTESLSPELRECVGHILKGGRHLLALISEILDIARIEEGRLAIELEPVPLQHVMQEVFDLIRPLAAWRDVRLDAVTDSPERHIRVDRQRIRQVLLNLLSNAVKYNHAGGTVTLGYEDIPGDRLRIKVSDTGPGIPSDKMDRLFIPFDRLGAEQTGIEGTGLGLALSKRLVEAMEGRLGVDSIAGQGSTFWAEFPLARGLMEEQSGDAPGSTGLKTLPKARLVVYIEDDPASLELVKRLLADRPEVRLIPAMQGSVGLDLARQHRPHLILVDLHLPDISGEEVLARLQEDPETRRIPVIVVSADATLGTADRLLAAGAHAYLTKPLDVRRFRDYLNESMTDHMGEHR